MFPEIFIGAGALFMLSGLILLMPPQWVAGLLLAELVHELGHMLAVLAFGGSLWAIHLGAWGARIETGPLEPWKEVLCALAGPGAGGMMVLFWPVFPALAVCSGVQTVFNLLPLPGFDGARIIRSLSALWKEKSVAKGRVSVYNKQD